MMRPADLPPGSNEQGPGEGRNPVWQGNLQEDWARSRQKLHGIGTDKGRIALWRRWLADSVSWNDSKKPITSTIAHE